MVRRRPCRICRRWFDPHPRVGERQRVCSDPSCQRERHRRSCEESRRKKPGGRREERLRGRLRGEAGERAGPGRETKSRTEPVASRPGGGAGRASTAAEIEGARVALGELRLAGLRDVVPLEVYVILDEILRLLGRLGRDVVVAQSMKIQGEFGGHAGAGRRDEIASGRGPP